MIVVHCHTDYYGPQLIGAFSNLEVANKFIMRYFKLDSPPMWSDKDVVGVEHSASIYDGLGRHHVDVIYFKVQVDSDLQEI